MKTRVGLRAIDGLTGTPAPFAGVAAIAGGDNAAADRRMAAATMAPPKCWCCRAMRRARPASIIHWTDEAARRATLAVAASLLRHVSAEAVYLGIVPEGAPGSAARRADARAARRALRGAADATASRCAPNSPSARPSPRLTRNLSAGTAQMLVLGITDITPGRQRLSQPAGRAARLAGAHRLSAGRDVATRDHRPRTAA